MAGAFTGAFNGSQGGLKFAVGVFARADEPDIKRSEVAAWRPLALSRLPLAVLCRSNL